MRHVRDVDARNPAAALARLDGQGVVKIARRVGVHREDAPVPQVEPPRAFGLRHFRRECGGRRLDSGRKLGRKVVLGENRTVFGVRGAGLAKALDKRPLGLHVRIVPAGQFHHHAIARGGNGGEPAFAGIGHRKGGAQAGIVRHDRPSAHGGNERPDKARVRPFQNEEDEGVARRNLALRASARAPAGEDARENPVAVEGGGGVRKLDLQGLAKARFGIRKNEGRGAARVKVYPPEDEFTRAFRKGEALLLHDDDDARHAQGVDFGAKDVLPGGRHLQLCGHARQRQGHVVPAEHEPHHSFGRLHGVTVLRKLPRIKPRWRSDGQCGGERGEIRVMKRAGRPSDAAPAPSTPHKHPHMWERRGGLILPLFRQYLRKSPRGRAFRHRYARSGSDRPPEAGSNPTGGRRR